MICDVHTRYEIRLGQDENPCSFAGGEGEYSPSFCVGQAIVQGDEGPVSGVAQGVEDHAGVRHEKEKEEGEVEQEVEGEKEENNTQGRRHMCMDGMKVKRQMRSALSQSEDVNTSDAQCCMVSSSACVALFTLLFTMRSMSVRMCL